jgi:hypothetical protein
MLCALPAILMTPQLTKRTFQKRVWQPLDAPWQGASGCCPIRFWNALLDLRHTHISLTRLILIGDEPAASMCSSTIMSLDRIDYWVACECKWDNSGDTTAVLKHWARALCGVATHPGWHVMSVHSECMPWVKTIITQSDRHVATAFCSLTVIPSHLECIVRCRVLSHHKGLMHPCEGW